MSSTASARPPCPICEGPTFQHVFEAVGHRFERCTACGFQRQADPEDDATLDDHYAADEEHGWEAYQEHDKNLVRFDGMLARIEHHLGPAGDGAPRRLLDVGCSIGSSLVAARERGWEGVGTELCRPAVEFARKDWKLDVREGDLEGLAFEPGSFDAVLMNHTLEHLREPDRVMVRIAEVLRPGGVCYQSLPNHGSLKAVFFGRHWSYGVHPGHLSLFTKSTLRRLFTRAGLRVVEVSTRSSTKDPHLLYNVMMTAGQGERLQRWCGTKDGELDKDGYIRFLDSNRIAHFLCNRLWPGPVVQALSLGEDLHMLAVKR